MGRHPREEIGRTLAGDVLEIGPGHEPFPTGEDARVVYADRAVAGGRDAIWPELSQFPRGPQADLDIDLDVDRLTAVGDATFDVVIASHLVEHLANPLAALREFERVLRPAGRLVLVLPDRTRTFDVVRDPTPLAHVLDELAREVTEVDAEHIREFCAAIYRQPPRHPPEVREWHDPARLDAERLDLHRRRSIHAHCWTAEEFAVLLAGCIVRGLMSWQLDDLFFVEDAGEQAIEFGLVLERPSAATTPLDRCTRFVGDWVRRLLDAPGRDPGRVSALYTALARDFAGWDELEAVAPVAADVLAAELVKTRARESSLTERLRVEEQGRAAVLRSRSYRAARVLGAPLRLARRRRRV